MNKMEELIKNHHELNVFTVPYRGNENIVATIFPSWCEGQIKTLFQKNKSGERTHGIDCFNVLTALFSPFCEYGEDVNLVLAKLNNKIDSCKQVEIDNEMSLDDIIDEFLTVYLKSDEYSVEDLMHFLSECLHLKSTEKDFERVNNIYLNEVKNRDLVRDTFFIDYIIYIQRKIVQ